MNRINIDGIQYDIQCIIHLNFIILTDTLRVNEIYEYIHAYVISRLCVCAFTRSTRAPRRHTLEMSTSRARTRKKKAAQA